MGVLSPLSGVAGQNEYSGAKQVTRNFYLYAKIREHMMIRSTFLLSQVPVTISSLAFNSETKYHDSLCPTLPYHYNFPPISILIHLGGRQWVKFQWKRNKKDKKTVIRLSQHTVHIKLKHR